MSARPVAASTMSTQASKPSETTTHPPTRDVVSIQYLWHNVVLQSRSATDRSASANLEDPV